MRLAIIASALATALPGLAAADGDVPAPSQAVPVQHRPEHDAAVKRWLDRHGGELLATYKHLHAHPELSLHEEQTAALVAQHLRESGYTVEPGVGGHGVVGLLRNGPGPTVLLRGDMDALPIVEETGLPYQSRVKVDREGGEAVGVMHACGHDLHVTNLLSSARFLAQSKDLWSGSLLIVAQPAEELGRGAAMMLEAGLFSRFAKPDYALALHVDPALAAGEVGLVSGWATANVDSVDITLFGRGGHGARPHQARDPIAAAAYLITTLQTLVSRRLDPQEPGVVTVGSIHAGTKHNVIPDQATLQLTVRSYSEPARRLLLDGITQLARDVCSAHRCDKPPRVVIKDEFTPSGYNHPELTQAAREVFSAVFGPDRIASPEPTMGGEDFARYSRASGAPGLLFRLGTTPRAKLEASARRGGKALPGLHSSRYAPAAKPSLRTAVRATSNLVLALMPRP